MMTKKGVKNFVSFMILGTGALVLGCGCISHYNVYALFFTLSIYGTLIVIVSRDNTGQCILFYTSLNADSLFSHCLLIPILCFACLFDDDYPDADPNWKYVNADCILIR